MTDHNQTSGITNKPVDKWDKIISRGAMYT